MRSDMRQSGISLVGELPWGSRFCHFYQTTEELLDILVPFFRAGAENNEFCLWVLADDSMGVIDTFEAASIMGYVDKGQMEVIPYSGWCARDEESGNALAAMVSKALSAGFDGLRLTCTTSPALGHKDLRCGIDDIGKSGVIAAFAYYRDEFDALGLMEVVKRHRFALIRNHGEWEVIESSEAHILREELKKSEELYRSLFENMLNGFAYCRMLYEGDRPVDFIYLAVNNAFEELTGLKDVAGKRVSRVIPGIRESDPGLFEIYDRVTRSGIAEQFELYIDALKMWFSVSVYSPLRDHFVAIFDVITARRQAETEIVKLNDELRRNIAELSEVNARFRDSRRAALNMMEDAVIARRQAEKANDELNCEITERKQAERALAEAKRALEQERDILEAVMKGATNSHLVYLDRDFNFVRVNDTYAQTCGYRPEEMIGKNHFALYPNAENEAIFARVRDTGEAVAYHDKPFEFPEQPERGVTYWDWTLMPVNDPAGRVDGLVFSLYETTERKRTEAAIQRSNARLDLLAETAGRLLSSDSPQLIVDELCPKVMKFLDCHAFFNFLVDEQEGRLHLNACAGIPEEEVKRIEWLDYGVAVCGCAARDACRIVAEDIPTTQDPRTELVKSYGIQAYACHPLMAEGHVIGTLSFGTSTRTSFSDDDLALMKAVADQVAIAMERKRAEEKLRCAHDELELRVKERTEELATTVDALRREIAEREQAEIALREETFERLRAVEALREKEQMLMQQSRLAAMGEMINNIAHQWRQPLNVLGLLVQQMRLFYDMGTFTRDYLDTSVTKSMGLINHMSRTIDDFRNFFKPDKEKVEFSIQEVVAKTVSLVEDGFKSQQIAIEFQAHANPAINGFPNEYSQALLNILMNARDALLDRCPEAARVTVTIGKEGKSAVVTIADNAGGIPEGIIGKIFEPYFTTKGPDKGTGVGLFMSKAIIEKNMHGRLTARNTAEGAEFRIEV